MNDLVCSSAPAQHVRVLLATYNGATWLDEQLASLVRQEDVRVSIVASDDASTDETPALLKHWMNQSSLQCLPPAGRRFGNASRNFLRLIREAPLDDAAFVALADQDDIWLPHKLARATSRLSLEQADAYSSDVIAFWPDGRRARIVKSRPQRRHDHLFESAGPGCTFVFPRAVFERLRAWVGTHYDSLQDIRVHDWLIYAHGRQQCWRWIIDDAPGMLYRQHGRNEIGANAGAAAALARWRQIRAGSFRRDVLAIADAVGDRSWVSASLRRFGARDRLRLILGAGQCRRRALERVVLSIFFLFMPRRGTN